VNAVNNPLIDKRSDIDNAYEDASSMGGGFVEGDGWEKGITAIEAGQEIAAGIKSGDWIEVGLGVVAGGLDVVSAAFDPIGYAAGQLVSWMMEHLEPLRKVLHGLSGEPNMVKGYAGTWERIGGEMEAVGTSYTSAAESETSFWAGEAGGKYRTHAHHLGNLARSTVIASDALKTAAEMAAELVTGVRTMVRDVISALVGYLVSLVVEELCTLGLATPVVIAQGVSAIGRAAAKVATFLLKLGKSIAKLAPFLVALRDILDGVYKAIRVLAESK
jgi:hypothetical protein